MTSAWVGFLYVLLAVSLGLFLAGSVPLGQVADELAHVLRADSLTYGELVGVRGDLRAPDGRLLAHQGVIADPELLASVASPVEPRTTSPQLVDRAGLLASQAIRFSGHPKFLEVGTIAGYFPAFYVPAAASIAVAKILGAPPNAAFRAARLANLFVSCLIGLAAVVVAARGKILLLAITLLPTTLGLDASASEDGLIIATSALAAACATRLNGGGRRSASVFWILALCLALICLAKPRPSTGQPCRQARYGQDRAPHCSTGPTWARSSRYCSIVRGDF